MEVTDQDEKDESQHHLLERADMLIREVKDGLPSEERHKLDHALMLLLHHRTTLHESKIKANELQIKVLQEFQAAMFRRWDDLEILCASIKRRIQGGILDELTKTWPPRFKEAGLYSIASILANFAQMAWHNQVPEPKLRTFVTKSFQDLNEFVTNKLGLPSLQFPYYGNVID